MIADCSFCGSKQVVCWCIKLRDSYIAIAFNDNYYKNLSDTAVQGTEKYLCGLCMHDIATELFHRYILPLSDKNEAKPIKTKKVISEPIKESPAEIDAALELYYFEYIYEKGYSDAQMAKRWRITESEFRSKVDGWLAHRDEEIRKYDAEPDITEEERIKRITERVRQIEEAERNKIMECKNERLNDS